MNPTVTRYPSRAVNITASDATYMVPSTIYVGGAGNVTVEPENGGNTALFSNLPAGSTLPCRVVRVLATGTTATLLTAVSG